MEKNIALAESITVASGLRRRPHFKAHKCIRLMRRQLASGVAVGATCQTAREALVLARAGVNDILVANEVVTDDDLRAVAQVSSLARLTVAIDHPEHIRLLATIVPRLASVLGVVIEVDVGSARCGVRPDSLELVALADAVLAAPGLGLEGILAYEGHLSLKEDPRVRRSGMHEVKDRIEQACASLEKAGHAVRLVTGGGTGTLALAAELGTHAEVQPGSYVLMDSTYQRLDLGFEAALYCLGTVISRPAPDRAVLDAGLKAMTIEYGMPRALDPDLHVTRLADEHAVATVAPGAEAPIGSKILLQPSHIDPTVNLHDRLHVWDGAGWDVWPVDGRR